MSNRFLNIPAFDKCVFLKAGKCFYHCCGSFFFRLSSHYRICTLKHFSAGLCIEPCVWLVWIRLHLFIIYLKWAMKGSWVPEAEGKRERFKSRGGKSECWNVLTDWWLCLCLCVNMCLCVGAQEGGLVIGVRCVCVCDGLVCEVFVGRGVHKRLAPVTLRFSPRLYLPSWNCGTLRGTWRNSCFIFEIHPKDVTALVYIWNMGAFDKAAPATYVQREQYLAYDCVVHLGCHRVSIERWFPTRLSDTPGVPLQLPVFVERL